MVHDRGWIGKTGMVAHVLGGLALLLVLGCAGERPSGPPPDLWRVDKLGMMLPTTCPAKDQTGAELRCATGAWQINYECVPGLPCGAPIKLLVVIGKDGNIIATGGVPVPLYGQGFLFYDDPNRHDLGPFLIINLYPSQQDASTGNSWKLVGQFYSDRMKDLEHAEGVMHGYTPDKKQWITTKAVADAVHMK